MQNIILNIKYYYQIILNHIKSKNYFGHISRCFLVCARMPTLQGTLPMTRLTNDPFDP